MSSLESKSKLSASADKSDSSMLIKQPEKSQLAVIFITVFIYLLGFGIIIPILPILSREFGATPFVSGLLMSVFSLMQFLFSPFWGRLSDKLGRKPILLFCLVGEGCSYLLFANSHNLLWLFIARILAGFFGASISTASAYISDITPPDQRSKGMALIGAAFGLGFVFGPAIGGGIAYYGSKISQSPYFAASLSAYAVAGLCFLTFIFGWFKLKESLNQNSENSAEHLNHKKNRFIILFEKLKIPTVNQLIICFFLVSFAMSSMESTLILYMKDLFNWQIKEVSYGFAYIGVIIVFTQGFLVRRLLPKLGEKKVLTAGLVLFFSGMGLISVSHDLPMMCLSMTLLSLGNGLTNPSILGSISLLSDATEQGSTLGVTQSLSALGRILGPALGGLIYSEISKSSPFIFSSLLGLAAFIIVKIVADKIPQKGKTIV